MSPRNDDLIGDEIRFVERMTQMTHRNFDELRQAMVATIDPRLHSYSSSSETHNNDTLLEVTRRLESFLASAISRVDRCQPSARLLRNIDPTLEPDVAQRIDALNSSNPVYVLADYLRNESLHVSYHSITAEIEYVQSAERAGGTVRGRVFVVRPQASAAHRTRRGKNITALVNAFPKELEIGEFAAEFNAVTDEFIVWYYGRLESLRQMHDRG
jgi:hypothetical protein